MTMTVKWYGDKVKAEAKAGAAWGLMLGAEHILEESNRVVPIEEATLQRSGVPSVDTAELRAAVSYDTPYAVPQHEHLEYQHDAGRKAKYLEDTVNSASVKRAVEKLIGREIKRRLG